MPNTFQNVDKKYKKKPIEVLCEVSLVYPYNVSANVLIEMIRLWDMKLFESSLFGPTAKVLFTIEKFKALFQQSPVVGKVYKLKGTESFIVGIKVIKIGE